MRRRSVLSVLLLLLGTLVVVPPSVATATATAAPYCGITWGSLPKSSSPMSTAPVDGARAGRHACFDRFVVDVDGRVGGWSVRYVTHVTSPTTGKVIPTRGGAALQVTVKDPAYDNAGRSTYSPANPNEAVDVTGYTTFRQVVWAGTFEGYSDFGLGVRARLPFRVLTLAGPGDGSRLVIDVAHRW